MNSRHKDRYGHRLSHHHIYMYFGRRILAVLVTVCYENMYPSTTISLVAILLPVLLVVKAYVRKIYSRWIGFTTYTSSMTNTATSASASVSAHVIKHEMINDMIYASTHIVPLEQKSGGGRFRALPMFLANNVQLTTSLADQMES